MNKAGENNIKLIYKSISPRFWSLANRGRVSCSGFSIINPALGWFYGA
jgi:hypothetical protein